MVYGHIHTNLRHILVPVKQQQPLLRCRVATPRLARGLLTVLQGVHNAVHWQWEAVHA